MTKKVFVDLAIWMVAFGVIIGLVLPWLLVLMGVPAAQIIKPTYFGLCAFVGILVGALNIALAQGVVGKRLRMMAERMMQVESRIKTFSEETAHAENTTEDCFLPVESDDELGQAAQAFNRLTATSAQSVQTQAAVYGFSVMLTGQLDLTLLSQQTLQHLLALTQADGGALLLDEGGSVTLGAMHGLTNSAPLLENKLLTAVLNSGERHRIPLPEDIVLDGVLTEFHPREIIVEPIRYKGISLGIVVLASTQGFTPRALIYLDLVQNSMALALNNALAHERLQRLAAIDPLTAVYNRRFGMARFHEEFSRAVRLNTPLGLMMIDIDHFKTVNDTYGHLVGDRVLQRVAQMIKTSIREGDLIMRYGGEEYLVVLPAASQNDAQQLAERLCRIIEEMEIRDGDQRIHTTISIGITSISQEDTNNEQDMLRHADEALYAAKQAGRNCVSSR
jgi:diguanylate cyclase (GGDEF)-like protein